MQQQQQGDMDGGLFRFFTYLLCSPGLVLSFSMTKTGQVGGRALMNPATGAGMLVSLTLIGLSAPPLMWVIAPALVWMAAVRHRVWPEPDFHSRSVGDCWLWLGTPDAGRAVSSAAAVIFGALLADGGGPYAGLGIWLVLAGGGQAVLHAMFNRKRSLQDQDSLDALYDAKDRAARLGRQ